MAHYLNQVAKPSTRMEAEVIANRVGLGVRAVGTETKAVGRGFWNGLLGNVALPDEAAAQAVPSIDDIATLVAEKVMAAQPKSARK